MFFQGGKMTDPGGGMSFGDLLRRYREQRRLTQSALARQAGLDPSFINRLEHDQRGAERPIVDKLAAGLGLSLEETDDLFARAGYLPPSFGQLGLTDPTLRLVAQILTDPRINPADRADFRDVIRLIGARWLSRLPGSDERA